MTRAEALIALLALAPPAALPIERMGCKPRQPGLRDPDFIKRDLGTAYVAHRRNAHGQDISCVVSSAKRVVYNQSLGTIRGFFEAIERRSMH